MLDIFVKKPLTDISTDKSLSKHGRKRQRAKTEGDSLVMKRMSLRVKAEDSGFEQENMNTAITEYEQMRQRNIAEKKAFLESLNIDQDLELLKKSLPKEKKVKGVKIKQEKNIPIRPKSLRIQGLQPDASPLPTINTSMNNFRDASQDIYDKPRQPSQPFSFFSVCMQEESESETFTSSLQSITKEKILNSPVSCHQYTEYFDSMKLPDHMVTKITPARIFSLAFHPSSSRILLAAGSKWGHIGLLTVNSNEEPSRICCYEPHVRPVNCLEFCSTYSNRVYSCSYDGTMRCGDLEKAVFNQVYGNEEEKGIRCTYFDFMSPETFLVSQSDGTVALVDSRSNGTLAENVYNVHLRLVKTVNVNQSKKNYFITACNDGLVRIFDLRSMKKKTPSSIVDLNHEKCVNSAFFSPLNGNYILCTTMEHKLKVYDSSVLDDSIKLKRSIRHDCHTGRWLTPFRAVWLPGTEETFIVGSMDYPRHIKVYDNHGHNIHNFSGGALASVCSINAFHPRSPILAGGNSSGKIHVFVGEGVL